MKKHFAYALLFILLPPGHFLLFAQGSSSFDIEAYRRFLTTHQNLSAEQLASLHPAGTFSRRLSMDYKTALYFDSIDARYELTEYEKSLLGDHGFVVTERLRHKTFADALVQIYSKDLPVFISTDAILHALHMSYDEILKDVETGILIGKLDSLLFRLHGELPSLAAKYAASPSMKQMLLDVDLYLTVPRILLGKPVAPVFAENNAQAASILSWIGAYQPRLHELFSSTRRWIDFSQFTPRGHYTQSLQLTQYFQAMIWLGKMEFYLIAPENVDPPQKDEDIQRQTIDAVLIAEAAEAAGATRLLNEIDTIIRFFVGESDNVTLANMKTLIEAVRLDSASQLTDLGRWKAFQDTLKQKSFAFQRINSQILISSAMDLEKLKPASSFLLLGQRFVLDSYVTGNVVYDNIAFEGRKIWRALPSTLDVLFALGNDAAAQLLDPELQRYHYASNLAALRYLSDSYEPEFWNSTLYNGWLNLIRALAPPGDRDSLPLFMQTAAWWQEKMNTQLASWAQLRHDNLLYAKQSYTGGTTCSFPEAYVEPIPEFYDRVRDLTSMAAIRFQDFPLREFHITEYFQHFRGVADTLGSIARKELRGISLSSEEKLFLKRMLSAEIICTWVYNGWYFKLYYTGTRGFEKEDFVVADVHTCPTDEVGTMVGWVLHAGTGQVDLAVVAAEVPDGKTIAFVGPVLSYYEHVSTNFRRITDEEWKTMYLFAPSFRPSFVNLYLADSTGSSRGDGPSLLTGKIEQQERSVPVPLVLGQNYPNPFNSSTIIVFSVPLSLDNSPAELTIYNVQGQVVRRLIRQTIPAGNYAVRWDGRRENGLAAASGVYFYHLMAGSQRQVGRMSLIR